MGCGKFFECFVMEWMWFEYVLLGFFKFILYFFMICSFILESFCCVLKVLSLYGDSGFDNYKNV